MSDETFELNGVAESDFQRWKHHPVTKVFIRYLLDCAEHWRREQVDMLRVAPTAPEPFRLGEYKGAINTLAEIAATEFHHMLARYEEQEPQEDENGPAE